MIINTRNSGRTVEIDDARIVYRNFAGKAGVYNREGERSFAVVIPSDEQAQELIDMGLNVKIKEARDDFEEPFRTLKVKVNYRDNGRGPTVYVRSGDAVRRLDEVTIGSLDNIDIKSVNMDLNLSEWVVNGKEGKTAYLEAIDVVQNFDRFGSRYNEEGILD